MERTAKAICHWDLKAGVSDPKYLRYYYQMWDYTCRGFALNPGDFIFIDLDGTLPLLHPPNEIFRTLEEALKHFPPEYDPVYIHANGTQALAEFDHPKNAIYIVGPNYEGLKIPKGETSVMIPAWNDLWGHVALGITLYDRERKLVT